MSAKKISMPTGITIETEDRRWFMPYTEPVVFEDITVEMKPNGNRLAVYVTAERSAVRQVVLHWAEALPEDGVVLGGAWERGYGDLEWRHYVPERVLPWYFLVQSGETVCARGVRVRPGAMCYWTAEAAGYSLYLDTRCGGMGVLLNGRTLHAADICAAEFCDTDGFDAQCEFFEMLCSGPILPKEPVYGANNWYHAYGNATEADILRETEALAKLTEGLSNRPWFVIDDGWQVNRGSGYIGGPWDRGNAGFPDMPGLAEKIREMGVKPGIWMRPLLLRDPEIPENWRLPRDADYLDPSVPEVLARVHTDVRRLSDWGYKLIKHDFSTFDIFGRWGFDMKHDLTDSNWRFRDGSRTTAEIIIGLYRTILDAAGDAMILGCNCIGHLGAGLMHMNRTGDDTSGRLWARTRKMGINTLAFTIAQEGSFYAIDADCVALTDEVDEELSLLWLDLVARSGTALFVSTPAAHLNEKLCAALRKAYAIASEPMPTARPLDWRYTTCPARWRFADGDTRYNWAEPCGIRFE